MQQPSTVITFLSCTCGFAILTTASTAVSGEPTADTPHPSFGARGQVVLDDLLKASTNESGPMLLGLAAVQPSGWASVWRTSSEDNVGYWNYTMTRIRLNPTIDCFVQDGLSIGGSVFYQYANYETGFLGDYGVHTVGLAPRVGLAWPLGKDLSLWSRLGGGYNYQVGNVADGPDTRGSTWRASAEIMLVVQPSESLIFSVGPGFAATAHATKDGDSGATMQKVTSFGGSMGAGLGVVL